MATEQTGLKFYTAQERADRLRKMVDKERRTQTMLLNEALDLLFASRDKEQRAEEVRVRLRENHSVKT